MELVSVVGIVLLVLALLFALREARLANPSERRSAVVVPLAALTAAFLFVVAGWGFRR